jgi:hypothetical protein
MRLGFLRCGRSGAVTYEYIKRRNRAAYDGNIKLDQALIRLGYLSPEEIVFCNERYGVDVEQYVGSSRETEVHNIPASIETELLLQQDYPLLDFRNWSATCGRFARCWNQILRVQTMSRKLSRPMLTLFLP